MTEPIEPSPSNASQPANPNLIDQAVIEPQTERNQPDKGTKLFVLFFFLIVPPLGVILLCAICWTLWKALNA